MPSRQIVEGELDHISEQAFTIKGGIEEVLEHADSSTLTVTDEPGEAPPEGGDAHTAAEERTRTAAGTQFAKQRAQLSSAVTSISVASRR